ncbi:TetR/AcrR family transcriptional regulator [Paraconexibacter sp.]|uniref:TetR/AcrR family transcriptional regulator n=1 Tax=Paraconexibacter sp. TaxID=2949640 RepID=UPI0035622B9E
MPPGDTRQRMIETASRLFQRDGYHATSWRGLVEEAQAPWGSIHHHFPGGKEELGVAAIEAGSDAVAAAITYAFASTRTPAGAIERLFSTSAALMEASGYETACPVASVAVASAHESPALTTASRTAFRRWEDELADRLAAGGVPRRRAPALAGHVMTLLEGALVRARVHGSAQPLRDAGSLAADLVRQAAAP